MNIDFLNNKQKEAVLASDGPLLIFVAPFIEESKLFVLTIFEYALFVAFYIVIFCIA